VSGHLKLKSMEVVPIGLEAGWTPAMVVGLNDVDMIKFDPPG
jgi:hypothetical protein